VRRYPPIAMHEDAAFSVQQVVNQPKAFVNHRDKRIRAATPSVPVGNLFKKVRLLMKGLAADLDIHAEVRAYVEGRVNVDELQPAGVLDLSAERPALSEERISLLSPQMSLLVQPLS
jgi:hypothetical protein